MLTKDEMNEIFMRYHRADWEKLDLAQTALDIGRLIGHASAQQSLIRALENELAAAELAGDALEEQLREAKG